MLTTSPPGMELFVFLLAINQVRCSVLTGMVRGAIVQSTSNPLQYSMTMTWTPGASAWGAFLFTVSFLNIQTNNPHLLFFIVILLI